MMLLYLCSNQNIDLFNFLEEKDYEIPIKKLSGTFNLKQFVIRDVRNLKQFRYFVIDLKALKDSEDEIIEAVIAFEAMYRSRVIIFAEGFEGNSSLISRLIDNKIYNIITSSDYDEIKEEMIQCISPEGKDIKSVIKKKYSLLNDSSINEGSEKYSFMCKDIKIAVVGIQRRSGTTTIAFNLMNFLSNAGADASYIEANTHGHLVNLPGFYMEIMAYEDYLGYKGVKYYFNGKFPEVSNFIVIDFGSISECKISTLKQCDLVLVCGTARPYEIESIKTALASLGDIKTQLILSLTPVKDQKVIDTILVPCKVPVNFYQCSSDLFDGSTNAVLFRSIIKDYITEVEGRPVTG